MTSRARRSVPDPARVHLDTVYEAFCEVLAAGMQPTLTSSIQTGNNWRQGEYDIVIDPLDHGVLHEDLEVVIAIAARHGGRVWIGKPDQKVSILFPYEKVANPGEPSPADIQRRKSRAPARRKPAKAVAA